jgi:hypothetical protein
VSVVQILGTAPNIVNTPPTNGERWCANVPRAYRKKGLSAATHTYTRWFNLHTARHIQRRYPSAWEWYSKQNKPIYLQEAHPDIKSSITFPREAIQAYFSTDGSPFRYFTGSVTWLIALAIMEKFNRIELHGYQLARASAHDFERPGFFYWVERARDCGVNVILPYDLVVTPPGDPSAYTGPLYGFEPHSEFYAESF